MQCKPAYFSGNTGVIDSEADHGFISRADIFPTTQEGHLMFEIVRYSFTIVAFLCAAALGGERAFGQVLQRQAAYGSDPAKGKDLYLANCSACHLANGEGVPGAFPPLKGSGVVNRDDPVKHIQVVLNGMQGARAGGVVYASAMPPFAGVLSDVEIADIIDYERSSWGNHGTLVNASHVAAERARAQ
jgi:mono/diheme cytochrome c family protein